LGQGLSVAAGMAYAGKYYDKAPYRVYCLVGDGESAEGSIWEALNFASYYQLDNLVAIFDVNRLGQSEPTSLQHNMDVYRKRLEAFGFNALVIDGHDVEEVLKAFHEASATKGRPTAILAKTFKGKHFPGIENMDNWHGKALGDKSQAVLKHLQGLIANGVSAPSIPSPLTQVPELNLTNLTLSAPPSYKPTDSIATRFAYGTAIAKLAKNNPRVIALDGDTKNSTFSDTVKKVNPEQYVECFIAEQNMVGVGIGLGCRGRAVPFVSAFAAFFSRAFDQLRMGAISQANLKCVGSHAGVSIGEDGPSQMALEDLGMFRSIPDCVVFYPSDAVSCERAVELAANTKGMVFIRTSRPNTAVVYDNNEPFVIGQGKVLRSSPNDKALVIGSGVTLHEALQAHQLLGQEGISIRVIDPFTLKPIDTKLIIENAKAVGGKIITVEDHYPEGGIGEAVMHAVSGEPGITVTQLAVREIPRSGPPTVLLQKYGIDATSIVAAVKRLN